MITCTFENGNGGALRHVVLHAIVEKNNALLLIKRATHLSLEGGKWALPGGFLDRDESGPEGVLRELREESGWEGTIVSLFRINTNPNRPHEDRQNVALDYIITPKKRVGDIDSETSDVRWIPIDTLPPLNELAFDHGESIEHYLKYRTDPFPLPIIH